MDIFAQVAAGPNDVDVSWPGFPLNLGYLWFVEDKSWGAFH